MSEGEETDKKIKAAQGFDFEITNQARKLNLQWPGTDLVGFWKTGAIKQRIFLFWGRRMKIGYIHINTRNGEPSCSEADVPGTDLD